MHGDMHHEVVSISEGSFKQQVGLRMLNALPYTGQDHTIKQRITST